MATKKEMMRQLLKGVSWNETARSLGCSKATVAKCAAKMREEAIDAARLEAMTDAEVSGLFADGRSKRSEECLEPDCARLRPACEGAEDDARAAVGALLRL